MPEEALQSIHCIMPLDSARAATEAEGGGLWLPVLPAGEWDTSRQWWMFGIDFLRLAAADLEEVIRNFDAKVTGVDLFLNEEHRGGPALGWIQALKFEADLLWARVELTPPGQTCLDQKLYRYCSAEFNPVGYPYFNARTQLKTPNVLKGLALTNDPFFTEMPAVASSTGAGVLIATAAPAPRNRPPSETIPNPQENPMPESNALESRLTAIEAQVTDLNAANTELTAANATLTAENQRLQGEITQRKDEAQRVEFRTLFATIKQGDREIAPAHLTKLVDQVMAVPAEQRKPLADTLVETLTAGVVETGERGTTQGSKSSALSAEQKAINAAFGVSDEQFAKHNPTG